MAEFLKTAESIAREAGALLREFYHRGVRTEYKGDVDLVTAVSYTHLSILRGLFR